MPTLSNKIITHPWFSTRENEYIRWYPNDLDARCDPGRLQYPEPIGVYIHVPFCDVLCSFCPYNKRRSNHQAIRRYVQMLCREIEMWGRMCSGDTLRFIYFGGGTPSVLDARQLADILNTIRRRWKITGRCEVSLEAHPTHINMDACNTWQDIGVNRISTGIQSFHSRALANLGATHNSDDAHRAVEALRRTGPSYAIDLLYAYESQDTARWHTDLAVATDQYDCKHLSCYPLIPYGGQRTLSATKEIELACHAINFGAERGLKPYASCASGGFDLASTKHQGLYERLHWEAPQASFIGCGPGAFGYLGGATTVNHLDVHRYCNLIKQRGHALSSLRALNTGELMRRYFILGVKCHAPRFTPFIKQFRIDPREVFGKPFDTLAGNGLAIVSDTQLELTDLGMLMVDQVSRLFYADPDREHPHPEEKQLRTHESTLMPGMYQVSIGGTDET